MGLPAALAVVSADLVVNRRPGLFVRMCIMSSPEKPDFVLVEIGARGKLFSQDAEHAAAMWKDLQHKAPKAFFKICIGGYDDDPRQIWEIPEAAAYVRTWAQLVGITSPEAAEQAFRPPDNDFERGATIGLLDLCCVFGDKPLFTQPETAH